MMSEIAKCRCGAEARLSPPWSGRIRAVCVNDECDIRGPRALSEVEAVARWNALMRPRPVAEWVAFVLGSDRGKFTCGKLWLGEVNGVESHWVARCHLTDEFLECANPWAARAWLEERVRAAGFEVR